MLVLLSPRWLEAGLKYDCWWLLLGKNLRNNASWGSRIQDRFDREVVKQHLSSKGRSQFHRLLVRLDSVHGSHDL